MSSRESIPHHTRLSVYLVHPIGSGVHIRSGSKPSIHFEKCQNIIESSLSYNNPCRDLFCKSLVPLHCQQCVLEQKVHLDMAFGDWTVRMNYGLLDR
ncbi:hypothetical protein STEG23_025546, partial [Scotinomys teguina]